MDIPKKKVVSCFSVCSQPCGSHTMPYAADGEEEAGMRANVKLAKQHSHTEDYNTGKQIRTSVFAIFSGCRQISCQRNCYLWFVFLVRAHNTHTHTHTPWHIHTHTHTHTHTRTHTNTHTHTHTHARARTHTRTHARTHARTYTHTVARAHTHTHTHLSLIHI